MFFKPQSFRPLNRKPKFHDQPMQISKQHTKTLKMCISQLSVHNTYQKAIKTMHFKLRKATPACQPEKAQHRQGASEPNMALFLKKLHSKILCLQATLRDAKKAHPGRLGSTDIKKARANAQLRSKVWPAHPKL